MLIFKSRAVGYNTRLRLKLNTWVVFKYILLLSLYCKINWSKQKNVLRKKIRNVRLYLSMMHSLLQAAVLSRVQFIIEWSGKTDSRTETTDQYLIKLFLSLTFLEQRDFVCKTLFPTDFVKTLMYKFCSPKAFNN